MVEVEVVVADVAVVVVLVVARAVVAAATPGAAPTERGYGAMGPSGHMIDWYLRGCMGAPSFVRYASSNLRGVDARVDRLGMGRIGAQSQLSDAGTFAGTSLARTR